MNGWTKAKLEVLGHLVRRKGWHWVKWAGPVHRTVLGLVSDRGVEWEFRLRGGAWIRRAKQQQ